MGDRVDHGSGPPSSLARELADGIAIVIALIDPLAPGPAADGPRGQRVTTPPVGS